MKRSVLLCLIAVVIAAGLGPLAWGAVGRTVTVPPVDRSPMEPIAGAVSAITGFAISPLLGTGLYGAYRWSTADGAAARAALPWYSQIKYWLPILLIVAASAAKDAMGAAVPAGWKKPLDVLEVAENKLSGLVVAGAVVPLTIDTFVNLLGGSTATAEGPALAASGLAAIQLAAIDGSWFVTALALPGALAVFGVVWMASHAINVLILLSPWGTIDAALKLARTGLLGLVAVTSALNPWAGALLSLVVIGVAWLVAGWAYRLTVFGSIFTWDFFTLRSRRFSPAENDNPMFTGAHFKGLPVRTYGRLVQRTGGGLQFMHRPWPWQPPRAADVPAGTADLMVGRGMFFSNIAAREDLTLFLLPPRYRGHEETLARAYLMAGVRPAGLNKAWSALRELFGGRAAEPTKP